MNQPVFDEGKLQTIIGTGVVVIIAGIKSLKVQAPCGDDRHICMNTITASNTRTKTTDYGDNIMLQDHMRGQDNMRKQ